MREYRAIVARIAADNPRLVLDWGCGWGQVTHLLRAEGVDVVPFDYWPDLESDAVAPLERFPAIDVHASPDPVRLPFESGSFAAVLSLGVLEHVAHPHESLDELKRVLEPGGTLYIYKLPNQWSYLEKTSRLLGLNYHGRDPYDAVYTKRTAIALVEAHGFDVREFRRANMLPLTLDGSLATRASAVIWRANRILTSVPVLNLVATNLELVATAPR